MNDVTTSGSQRATTFLPRGALRSALRFGFLAAGLAAAVTPAAAAPLSEEAPQLRAAVESRIAALGAPPRGTPEATELKQLKKALAQLQLYRGNNKGKDLRALAKGGFRIVKSLTADGTVLAELGELVQAAIDEARAAQAAAVDALVPVTRQSDRDRIGEAIEEADGLLAQAEDAVPTDLGLAMNLAGRAAQAYGRARQLALAALPRLGGPTTIGTSTMLAFFALQNFDPRSYVISEIVFDGEVRDAANGNAVVGTVDGVKLRNLVPSLFDSALDRIIPAPGPGQFAGQYTLPGAVFRALNPTISTTNDFAGTITFQFPNGSTIPFPVVIRLTN